MKEIKVVAAIIENEHNELLCALRSPIMTLPNRWEFPGGKIEDGEDMFAALEREIFEELRCKIKAKQLFHENIHQSDGFLLHLLTIKCNIVEGIPIPHEHSIIIWLKRENLLSLKWAPADLPAVEQLIAELHAPSDKN